MLANVQPLMLCLWGYGPRIPAEFMIREVQMNQMRMTRKAAFSFDL